MRLFCNEGVGGAQPGWAIKALDEPIQNKTSPDQLQTSLKVLKMKASTLLTAMVLLLGAAAAPNYLTIIFNEIPKLNQSSLQVGGAHPSALLALFHLNTEFCLFQDFFVEDLTHLAEGVDNCGVRGVFLFIATALEAGL